MSKARKKLEKLEKERRKKEPFISSKKNREDVIAIMMRKYRDKKSNK